MTRRIIATNYVSLDGVIEDSVGMMTASQFTLSSRPVIPTKVGTH